MSCGSQYFATQRNNTLNLDRNNFQNVLALDIGSFESVRRQLVHLNAMVQVHFTVPVDTPLDYTIRLRLARRHRGDAEQLTTISLQRSYISGTSTAHSENLNLTWTDVLDRRCRSTDGLGDVDIEGDLDDLEISNCRDRNSTDVRYVLAVSFNTTNSLIQNITAQNRSLTAIVFPEGRRDGFNFFL